MTRLNNADKAPVNILAPKKNYHLQTRSFCWQKQPLSGFHKADKKFENMKHFSAKGKVAYTRSFLRELAAQWEESYLKIEPLVYDKLSLLDNF
jgi:hypothetical protein